MNQSLFSLCLLLLSVLGALSAPTDDAKRVELNALGSRLKYQTGKIQLGDNLASLNLSEKFQYLDPASTATLLTGIWGNPASKSKMLGAIVPQGFDPFNKESWCVVMDYSEDGYVSDSDAEKIDYSDLLKSMQKSTREVSEERKKSGYPEMELVGWAAVPHYEKSSHKFYWAKEIRFDGSTEENTLNYNIRVLGRRGVLVLNLVSGMSQLAQIEEVAPEILSMVDFTAGNTYADYQPGTDKVASYGLAALVAGGIAAKTGLFKGLFVALVAMKKFVIIGAIAVWSFVRKFFGGKSGKDGEDENQRLS